jgi:hypothetical protein
LESGHKYTSEKLSSLTKGVETLRLSNGKPTVAKTRSKGVSGSRSSVLIGGSVKNDHVAIIQASWKDCSEEKPTRLWIRRGGEDSEVDLASERALQAFIPSHSTWQSDTVSVITLQFFSFLYSTLLLTVALCYRYIRSTFSC